VNKTVLLYAHECAPYNRPASTMGAQRPFQFSKWLPKHGWNSILLCCSFDKRYSLDPKQSWEPQVRSIVNEALKNWDRNQSLIIPLPSLEYDGFVDKMWLGSVNVKSNGAFENKPGFLNGIVRKTGTLLKYITGDYSKAWQKVAAVAAREVIKGQKIDIQLAEHGPDASLFIARKIYKESNIPWVIDYRDPALRYTSKAFRPVYKAILKRLIKSCSASISVTPYWATLDEQFFNKPSYFIANGYDSDEVKTSTANRKDGLFKVWYSGGVNEHQSLQIFAEAFNLISKTNKAVKFIYRGNSHERVQSYFENSEFVENLDIQGHIDRNEAMSLMNKCDLVLLLSCKADDLYLSKGLYPGKVFEYMASQKFVINIPGDSGQLDALMDETNIGATFSNSADLAAFLEKCISDRVTLAVTREQNVSKYSRGALKLSQILSNHL